MPHAARTATRLRAAAALVLLVACSAPSPAAWAAELAVSAAASLSAVLPKIAAAFEQANPGVEVHANFAGSATLVQQIRAGAPADVLASADESSMQSLLDAGDVAGTPAVFARNQLAIVVQRGNPKQIAVLADLSRPDLVIALCAPSVPAGRYARELFARSAVAVPESSHELDVRAVVSRVALGEADAGIVYATDVRSAGDTVTGIEIPAALNVRARYPVAALRDAREPAHAQAFVRFLLGRDAQATLVQYGFLAP